MWEIGKINVTKVSVSPFNFRTLNTTTDYTDSWVAEPQSIKSASFVVWNNPAKFFNGFSHRGRMLSANSANRMPRVEVERAKNGDKLFLSVRFARLEILVHVQLKEVVVKNAADAHQLHGVQGVFWKHFINVCSATSQLSGEPHDCFSLLEEFFSDL